MPDRDEHAMPVARGGKEELRATVLKPYLLRLRDELGAEKARALLFKAGLPLQVMQDETSWVSVAAAKRALHDLESALGRGAIARRGSYATHPENLGAYVRLLRVSSSPIEAYRYLAAHAPESLRVGKYLLREIDRNNVEVVYTPLPDLQSNQSDRLLCLSRAAEFASIPQLWGLHEARVEHLTCVADGGQSCTYALRFSTPRRRRAYFYGAFSGLVSGGAVAVSGNLVAGAIGACVGSALGGAVGALKDKVEIERSARTFEQNRILALERGLELRGQFKDSTGDLTGAVLGGKYQILRKIGSGGIGVVYAAEHLALASKVAIKVLRGAAAANASEIARLRREAQVQVSIEHPNVVRTLDLDQLPDGSIYVVMELLSGESLSERLKRQGPLAPGFAVPVFRQVCRALSAAHKLGIVHRDLKPGNIFLGSDQVVKVLDFGMSKFAEAEALTQDGYTLGTPEYMSPEQCIGAPVEPRTDLYAFGVLMYEALTGEIPIVGRNRRELLELHQRTVPKGLRDRRPDMNLPSELDHAVMMCLKKRAAERPESAWALEQMLERVPLAGLAHEYPAETPRRSHSRMAPTEPALRRQRT